MAQQNSKPKWKVGSFLQQAVAGVESRLDLILAEEEEQKQQQAKAAAAKPNQSGNLSRSSSNARKNDRLQERLARAVVRSNTAGNDASSPPSRVASPVSSLAASNDPRSSLDVESGPTSPIAEKSPLSPGLPDEGSSASAVDPRSSHDSNRPSQLSREILSSPTTDDARKDEDLAVRPDISPEPQVDEHEQSSPRESTDIALDSSAAAAISNGQDKAIAQLQEEHSAAESRWQEETYGYIERIDALQSKLKYLAKEAAESAKSAAASADPGSVDKQLREKDEKIALLLEEGQKLSKTEMEHRMAIKKLRQQIAENTKVQTENKKRTDKLERDLASSEARAKRAEAAEKRANESLSSQSKVSKDLDAVTAERTALSQTVQEMKGQLARAVARAEAAEAKAQSDALEQQKRHASELEEELASTKTERDISEEKLNREIRDLKQTIDQEKEKARSLEAELKGEQSVLESKMESLRFKAEEASSGVGGDTQAKLLRQIETLQTQYAVASENWQTLEGSLLARLANVEKERDEIARREGELRRKVREANLKAKRVEEELETAKESVHDLESQLDERAQDLQKADQKLQKANDDLTSAQRDHADQKKVWDATWAQKLEDERAKWRDQALPPASFLRTESPVALSRRSSNLEASGSLSDYRPTSRRSSALPTGSPDVGTPPRQNSFPTSVLSPPSTSTASIPHIPETPTIAFDSDEYFAGLRSPSAHGAAQTHTSRGINDMISESTVGAGPSVQLVERMSATVRRLESERAASKDELARITTQRDEARQQVVDLMRESDEKKDCDARVQELESQIEGLDQRYQTTLEMLGEKSEQVDELQADITDLKKIYRELVDSTMK